MSKRDTEVRYVGAINLLDVPIPEADREFDDPREQTVIRGGTVTVSAAHAKGLIASGDFEPVKPDKKGDSA